MANYATNIFHASTENKQDLDKIEAFLDDNFNGFVNRYGDTVDAEFSSSIKSHFLLYSNALLKITGKLEVVSPKSGRLRNRTFV